MNAWRMIGLAQPLADSLGASENRRYEVILTAWSLEPWAFGLGTLLATSWAWAQGLDPLNQPRDWITGTIQDQLNADPTTIPFGKGAVFVPAMTNPLDEPPVTVFRGQKKVAEGTSGQRLVVSPGRYRVTLGSGAVKSRLSSEVEVQELYTSVVPPTWAGLAVHVVDENYNTIRGSYEVIRVEDREYIGLGFGADEQAGEPINTWILEPALYKIVRVGETYRARRDFTTVRLVAGELTHFLLVIDEDTGEFRGAGEVPVQDLFLAQEDPFFLTFILGGDFSFNSRQNVVGTQDGNSFAFRAFVDTKITAKVFGNPLILQLQVEEGQSKTPGARFQKTQDRADLDGLYVYRFVPWIGPYIRFGVETNLLEGRRFFENPTGIRVLNEGGQLIREVADAESLRLSPPLGLTQIKEGVGLNVRLFKTLAAETTIRAGVGARHRVTNNLLELDDDPSTMQQDYQRVPNNNQIGVETTLLSVIRLTRWVVLNVEVDGLFPFDELRGVVLEAEGTMSFKLTQFLSVNYTVRFFRDRSLQEKDRLEQDILLRFSVELP